MTTRYTADIPLETLPESWVRHVKKMRDEAASYRRQRNEARAALVSIIVERDAARAEVAELKAARDDG